MSILNLSKENFVSTISQNNIVMIDCWASWCDACETFNPVYEKAASANNDITFCKIDASKERDLLAELKVEHIPTLLLYRDGILLFKQAGYFEEEKLIDILNQAKSLDMDMVRAEIEKEKNK